MKDMKTAFWEGIKLTENAIPPKIEINSDKEAVVFGCRGILEYTPEVIRLISFRKTIRFCGIGLSISGMDRAAVIINGKITSIEFIC